eukprot:tig00000615_g2559.t1
MLVPLRRLACQAGDSFRSLSGALVHASAVVHPSATLEPNAVLLPGAQVGEGAHIGAGTVVGPQVIVGRETRVGYGAALSNCSIGERCIIHHGVRIGQDGFGFYHEPGTGAVRKKPQLLRVVVGSDVEIGANTCVDRGSWRDTIIGDNTKIDNLVQVAHNVQIGRGCFVCGQVGIAGSVTIGNHVQIGGQVGIAQHLTIGDRVRIAAQSGVTRSLEAGGTYAGSPAVEVRDWRHQVLVLRQLARDVAASRGGLGGPEGDP